MKRTISGITFIIHSPCHYEIVRQANDIISDAHIIFDGEFWTLRVFLRTGRVITREFTSRNRAIAMLAERNAA